jgi:crotonobetainyl-CoA:carnitine CoA-transferase CaiB-like acyl-CoA transferase
VFANFKPGTLTGLGFPYARLRELNPRIVLAESSAYGDTGPWSNQMGYGPLVRAVTGVTRLWTSEDAGADGRPPFLDAITIFPDHVVARIVAIAALAALIRRDRTERGAHVHISQAEAAINQLDVTYVVDEARIDGLHVADETTATGVYPCAGDDEWCVISIRDDVDWERIAAAIGRPGLDRTRCDVRAEISSWTSTLDTFAVTETLQQAGVAAGPMNRSPDVLADPQIEYRKLFTEMAHPLFGAPLPSETGPAPYRNIPESELRPAPMPGEHTRAVCRGVLGLDDAQIDELIADGVLFETFATEQGKVS